MNAFYTEISIGILQIVCALIGLAVSAVVVPWLKTSAIPWMREKQLYGLVQKFVQAAEKMAETGALDREKKKSYVVGLLEEKGYVVDDELEAFIESAVKELDMTVESGWEDIVEIFDDTEDEAENSEEAVH